MWQRQTSRSACYPCLRETLRCKPSPSSGPNVDVWISPSAAGGKKREEPSQPAIPLALYRSAMRRCPRCRGALCAGYDRCDCGRPCGLASTRPAALEASKLNLRHRDRRQWRRARRVCDRHPLGSRRDRGTRGVCRPARARERGRHGIEAATGSGRPAPQHARDAGTVQRRREVRSAHRRSYRHRNWARPRPAQGRHTTSGEAARYRPRYGLPVRSS